MYEFSPFLFFQKWKFKTLSWSLNTYFCSYNHSSSEQRKSFQTYAARQIISGATILHPSDPQTSQIHPLLPVWLCAPPVRPWPVDATRQHAQRTPSSCAAAVLHTAGFRGHKTPDPDTYVHIWIPALKSYLKMIKNLIQNLNSPILIILIHYFPNSNPWGSSNYPNLSAIYG